jgi:hypothetical protein
VSEITHPGAPSGALSLVLGRRIAERPICHHLISYAAEIIPPLDCRCR